MNAKKAVIELIFAAILWGFGFLATKWALVAFSIYDLLIYRFLIAFILGEIFYYLYCHTKNNKKLYFEVKNDFKISFLPGLFMALFIIPQTIGLKYTTATKSGFLTTLYVLFVPFINNLIFNQKLNIRVYLWSFLGLLGTLFLLDLKSSKIDFNYGDFLTIVCALMASFQIILIGKVANKTTSDFRMNNFQNLWSLLIILPFFIGQNKITFYTTNYLSWYGILFMAIGSSLIAFTIQVRAQKVLSNETASQLFLLESPFAFLFAFIFLDEKLNFNQAIGAIIIISSSWLTLREEKILYSKSMTPQ